MPEPVSHDRPNVASVQCISWLHSQDRIGKRGRSLVLVQLYRQPVGLPYELPIYSCFRLMDMGTKECPTPDSREVQGGRVEGVASLSETTRRV